MPPLSSSQELAVQTQIVRIMCKAHERAEWVSVQLAWVEKPCRVAGAGMRIVWGPTRAGFHAAVEGKVMRSLRGASGGSLGGPAWDHQWGGHRTLKTFQRSDIEDQEDHRRSLFQLSPFEIGKM